MAKKIILSILAVLILAAFVLFIANFGTIRSLYKAYRLSRGDVSAKEDETRQQMQEITQKITDSSIGELTDEQKTALSDGKISEQEAVEIILGEKDPQLDAKKARIDELVATVYVLKDSFSSRLELLLADAKAEYLSLPKSKRNLSGAASLLKKYGSLAGEMEDECDARITEILDELKTLVSETGGDPNLIGQIAYAYADEKTVKKAYYMDMYREKIKGLK